MMGALRLQPKGVVGFGEVKVVGGVTEPEPITSPAFFTVRRKGWSIDVPADFEPARLKALLDVLAVV